MSGWDATSRPTWDPQGGTSENTQSFGVPEFADDGGFPGSASPGTPPAIFLQDYDKTDFGQTGFEQNDFGQGDFGRGDAAQSPLGRDDFGQHDFGRDDFAQNDFGQHDSRQNDSRQNDFGQSHLGRGDFGQNGFGQNDFEQADFRQNDFGQNDLGQNGFGQHDLGQNGFGQNDFGQQDRGGRGYRGDEDPGHRGYDQRGSAPRDYAQQDFPRRDSREDLQRRGPDRDYAARDFADADREDRRDTADSDFSARMDPALRDFFAPQPTRNDPLQQAYGQPRHGARGYPGQGAGQGHGQGQGQGRGRGGQFGPGLSNGHRPPGSAIQTGQPGRWDTGAQRPGSRTARRHESQAERRGLAPAAVAIGLVVVLGIAIGAYMLLRGKPATPTAGTTPLPTSSATAPKTTTKTQLRPAAAARYTLKAPATAGGYAKLATIPSGVQTAAGTTAKAIKTAAVTAGGKVTSQVTAAYQLSDGQVLAFTGYEGTFNPAKVMAGLAALGTDSHTAAAGPHGGMLACATTPTPSGTVCVWVTTTTMGITEFFASSDLPEVVTNQAKAAADTLKFRASVEAPKP